MKTKNILIIFLGDFNYDARCINMLRSFRSENHRVTLIGTHEEIINDTGLEGVTFHSIKLKRKRVLKYVEFFLRVNRFTSKQKYDIVVASDLYSLASACVSETKKIIYDCREIYTELAALESKFIYKKITYLYENYFLRYVNQIITTAKSDEEMLKIIYNQHSHLLWNQIYNYPANILDYNKVFDIHKELNIKTNHKLIVYQGVIQKHRGVGQLIKLIFQSSGFSAIIIGDGQEKKYYEKLVKKYNVQDKVFFIGKIPYLDLFQYTLACDIGWLVIKGHGISNQLALPNKLFEYTIADLPIISSSLTNMEKIVEKYNLGVVVSEDNVKEQLAALKEIEKYFKKKNMNDNVKFTWSSQHQTLMNIINE